MTYTDLDSTKSKYEIDIHLPVPTLEYVKKRVIDLNTSGFELGMDATQYILNATVKAKTYLFQQKLQDTIKVMGYLFAFDEKWRDAFVDYVCDYIRYMIFAEDETEIMNSINSGLLRIEKFQWRLIRDVETSELEW